MKNLQLNLVKVLRKNSHPMKESEEKEKETMYNPFQKLIAHHMIPMLGLVKLHKVYQIIFETEWRMEQ